MKKVKVLERIIYWIVLTVLLLVAGFTAISAMKIPNGYKLMVVQSGSMEPTIITGSIVLIKPEGTYQQGDVVTFQDTSKSKSTVTHRIHEIKSSEYNQDLFVTKGDANNSPDSNAISESEVLGKVMFSIPLVGFVVNFAKTLPGLIVLILIPCTIIVYSEILNIKNETVKLLAERKRRKLSLGEKVEERIGEEILDLEQEARRILE